MLMCKVHAFSILLPLLLTQKRISFCHLDNTPHVGIGMDFNLCSIFCLDFAFDNYIISNPTTLKANKNLVIVEHNARLS